jgi:hypothetical protein
VYAKGYYWWKCNFSGTTGWIAESLLAGAPSITQQPTNQTVVAGSSAGFTVVASSSIPPAYQWQKNQLNVSNGGHYSGSTTATLTITGADSNDAASYHCVVTNAAGAVTSQVATLTVNIPPSISAQPQSVTVYVRSNATFSVTGSGTPAPAFQWRFNGAPISGATSSGYIVIAAQTTNEGPYTAVLTNVAGSLTSSPASLNLYREFGSAPASYPSLLASNGARHLVVPGFQLGLTNVSSTDARTNQSGADGVTFLTPLRPGQAASVQVVASAAGYLSGWLDFATNGSWTDPADRVLTNVALLAGTNVVNLTPPNTAVVTPGTWARFRFSSATNLSVTGEAPDGEVEDYQVAILANPAPVPPRFLNFDLLGDGSLSLSGTGGVGQSYVLLMASNLNPPLVWSPIQTNLADTNGLFQFTDPGVPNQPQRFYRLQTP